MKRLLKILPLALIFACGPQKPEGEVAELQHTRDSLQLAVLKMEKEITTLNKSIALKDTSNTKDELVLIKKIAIQKNKVVNMSKKLKKLENELASLRKEKKLTPVAVKELQPEPFKHFITVYGRVEASEFAAISPEIGGVIRSIHVKAGERVNKGQLLVSLNTDAIQSGINALEASLNLAKTTYEKTETLWEQGIGSEIEYLSSKSTVDNLESQLNAQKAQLRMSQIRAPFDGYVDKIHQKEGNLASQMFPVLDMVNMGSLQIKADVSETYVGQIHKGDKVEVSFSVLKEKEPITTPIIRTSKIINQSSRTFEIEMAIDNSNKLVKPNMVSSVRINDFSRDSAMIVPSMIISKDINNDYVYVIVEKDGQSMVEKRIIETSYSYNDQTLVTKGLMSGDKVVTEGYHLISAGVAVKVVG